ncbi:Aste57867_2764 [Aphanomyces stellatus]|uniref:Aste57867_2764 protein n=1 Tax=Aphanomyces stellatus TaxID=120398 RepID=A0A485KC03_9STRA|nr:hypothetical protein As57867_002757 [Aphanomyces stellatus]VFT79954.1 Aste57867_2764 [Aphanomyces stellatus]
MDSEDRVQTSGHGAIRTPKFPSPTSRDQPKRSYVRTLSHSLPKRYNGFKGFLRNSFFVKRLMWITLFLVLVDVGGIYFMYFSKFAVRNRDIGDVVDFDFVEMGKNDGTCLKWSWFAQIVYFTLPMVIFIGFSASGLRAFDLFKRTRETVAPPDTFRATLAVQQRITMKVQRTWYLQLCEITCALLMVFHGGMFFFVLVTFVQSSFTVKLCKNMAPMFNAFIAIISWLAMGFQFTYFTRLRDHLKMQLGAFKEGELTGTTKKASFDGAAYKNQPEKVLADIKKRLFTAAELSNVEDLRDALDLAHEHLGPDFAHQHFGSASMGLVFTFSQKNPMHAAATNGHVGMMQMLYDAGFSVNSLDKINRVRLSTGDFFWYLSQLFVRRAVVAYDESAKHLFKTTLVSPLHCAVAASCVDAVRWLVDHGADVNQTARSSTQEERVAPIFLCEHPTIMEMLLAANADHLSVPNPGGSHTLTVLELAYLRGNYAVGAVLEDWGGDVALTPLHMAAGSNNVLAVHKMLKYCDPNCLGEYGYAGFNRRTPLHWAAISGSADTLVPLLAKGGDPHFPDTCGRTPLHWAARVNRVACVQILLEHGANARARDLDGMTPALVLHGANVNETLENGDTALHIAMKRGNRAAALALLSAGADINAVNGDGSRAIDCTTSTELQFAVKRAAGSRDVMISYTHSHAEFAKKLRASLEQQHITTWLDLMDPSGIGGGSVWRDEIARGISNASCVVCILTEDYPKSEWCLKELAYAKQVGTPVLALSTEKVAINEELQVYLYTRQIVPFQSAIASIDNANPRNITYTYHDDQYTAQFRSLLDGVRDEIEKKRAAMAVQKTHLDWQGTLLSNTMLTTDDANAPFVFLTSGDCHEAFVRQVYTELSALCRVYLDHPLPTMDPKARISAAKEAILKCSAFVVVLSDKNQNEIVQDQLAFAEDKGRPILPILLSDPAAFLGLGLQYTLSRNEVYHFAQNIGFKASARHLVRGVEKIIMPPTILTLSRRNGYLANMLPPKLVHQTSLSTTTDDRWSLASDTSGTSKPPLMPRL